MILSSPIRDFSSISSPRAYPPLLLICLERIRQAGWSGKLDSPRVLNEALAIRPVSARARLDPYPAVLGWANVQDMGLEADRGEHTRFQAGNLSCQT